MLEFNTMFSILFLLSSIFVFSLSLLAFTHYKTAPSTKPMGLLMICAGFYSFGYAFEIMKGNTDWIFLWIRVEYIGLAFVPPVWLWLALAFTGYTRVLKPVFFYLVFGLSTLIFISVWTNNFHHLYYTAIGINHSGPFPTARLTKGILYKVNITWMLLSFILSFGIYIHYFRTVTSLFRKQILVMLVGAFIVFIDCFLYTIGAVFWNMDIGPLSITVSCFVYSYGIFKVGILDLSPIAREKIFQSMLEGVIVTDINGAVVDYNPTAQRIFPGLPAKNIGWNLLLKYPGIDETTDSEPLIMQKDGTEHYYDIKKILIFSGKSKQIGMAWYIRQITEQHNLMKKLKEYAEMDELTGIYNRRKWMELAKNTIVQAKIKHGTIAVMFIDVDHFKNINDTMGHEAGDLVLTDIIKTLNTKLTEKEIIGRIGGEEFAMVLTETDKKYLTGLAESLLSVIANHEFRFGEQKFSVTISAGLVICTNQEIPNLTEFMRQADHALYSAKNAGRNRVNIIYCDHSA